MSMHIRMNKCAQPPTPTRYAGLHEKLRTLKRQYSAVGIKSSFEDEGTSVEKAVFLRNLTQRHNMKFIMKVGGPEARTDIDMAERIGSDGIVGPMVESEFAAEKFIAASSGLELMKGINIETQQSIDNIDAILDCRNVKELDYICIGRVDLVASYKLDRAWINSKFMNDIIHRTTRKIKEKHLKVYMGGAVNRNTFELVRFLFQNQLVDRIESRYIIFDLDRNLIDNFNEALKLANEFELEYMKQLQEEHLEKSGEFLKRCKLIENRIAEYE